MIDPVHPSTTVEDVFTRAAATVAPEDDVTRLSNA